jgi:hypothetical protein
VIGRVGARGQRDRANLQKSVMVSHMLDSRRIVLERRLCYTEFHREASENTENRFSVYLCVSSACSVSSMLLTSTESAKKMEDGVDSAVEKVMGKENDFDFATGNHIEKGGQGPVMDGQTTGKTLCAHSYRLVSSNNCPNRSLTSATSSVKMLARSR